MNFRADRSMHPSPLVLSNADKALLDKLPLPKGLLGNTVLTQKRPPKTILGR